VSNSEKFCRPTTTIKMTLRPEAQTALSAALIKLRDADAERVAATNDMRLEGKGSRRTIVREQAAYEHKQEVVEALCEILR
jgi:hypothetical protein